MASSDRLRVAEWTKRAIRHWGGLDLAKIAELVGACAGLEGHRLPYTRIDGRLVFPFVELDANAAARRIATGLPPILDRAMLRDYFGSADAAAPPTAVRLTGYVTVEPVREASRHLVGLSSWAPTCAATPSWRPLDPFQAARCDYFDHCIIACDGERAAAVSNRWRASRPDRRRGSAWDRLRDEQLFQFALDCGVIAEHDLSLTTRATA